MDDSAERSEALFEEMRLLRPDEPPVVTCSECGTRLTLDEARLYQGEDWCERHWPSQPSRLSVLLSNIARTAAVGFGLGTLLSVYVVARRILNGPGFLERLEVTLEQVVLSYLGAGVFAGAIVGLLLPLARWAVGAMLVGAVAGMFVYGFIAYLDSGQLDVQFALLGGVAVGAPVGLLYRSIFG